MAHYMMLIDSGKCINCNACVVACQQRNNVPYGASRNHIRITPAVNAPTGEIYQPWACMHCDAAPCVTACPTEATWKGEDGIVHIDPDLCVGCGACIDACPYEARFRHPITGIADKCDFCQASGGEPACVDVCPVECRVFGDVDDPSSEAASLVAGRRLVSVSPENLETRPNLAYLDATVPEKLPAKPVEASILSGMGLISKGITIGGGMVLALIFGTFLRQVARSSEKEEQELHKQDQDRGSEQ